MTFSHYDHRLCYEGIHFLEKSCHIKIVLTLHMSYVQKVLYKIFIENSNSVFQEKEEYLWYWKTQFSGSFLKLFPQIISVPRIINRYTKVEFHE